MHSRATNSASSASRRGGAPGSGRAEVPRAAKATVRVRGEGESPGCLSRDRPSPSTSEHPQRPLHHLGSTRLPRRRRRCSCNCRPASASARRHLVFASAARRHWRERYRSASGRRSARTRRRRRGIRASPHGSDLVARRRLLRPAFLRPPRHLRERIGVNAFVERLPVEEEAASQPRPRHRDVEAFPVRLPAAADDVRKVDGAPLSLLDVRRVREAERGAGIAVDDDGARYRLVRTHSHHVSHGRVQNTARVGFVAVPSPLSRVRSDSSSSRSLPGSYGSFSRLAEPNCADASCRLPAGYE
jgi:hypothetical protein